MAFDRKYKYELSYETFWASDNRTDVFRMFSIKVDCYSLSRIFRGWPRKVVRNKIRSSVLH